MSKGFRVFCFQIKQELGQVRVLILFMILAVFIYSYLEPVADLAQAVGEKVSPWAFPGNWVMYCIFWHLRFCLWGLYGYLVSSACFHGPSLVAIGEPSGEHWQGQTQGISMMFRLRCLLILWVYFRRWRRLRSASCLSGRVSHGWGWWSICSTISQKR